MAFKMCKIFLISLILASSLAQSSAAVLIQEEESLVDRLAFCGGTVESDSDTLTYNTGSLLQHGELCVWTIHLQSRNGFSFNFSQFNVQSQSSNCRDGGVRIYALTNLVPPDETQSYGFCNNEAPPQQFFLGFNIAVVVLYVGSSNFNAGTGFELNWSGSAVDPFRTKHISSYSTAPEGLIKYPINGAYPTSLAATWLLKPQAAQVPVNVDLFINDIRLESCTVPGDECACDSIILYQVGTSGRLSETRRMCGQQSSIQFYNLEARFILAFFTDLEDLSGGEGFMAMYYPGTGGIDTTTTEDWSTTQEEWHTTGEEPRTTQEEWHTTEEELRTTEEEPRTTEEEWHTHTTEGWVPTEDSGFSCGEILEERAGTISYKFGENTAPNERCVWTIRSRSHSSFTFNVVYSGLSSAEHIYVNTFTNKEHPLLSSDILIPGAAKTFPGSVAVVTFASGSQLNGGRGFILSYETSGPAPTNISSMSQDLISQTSSGFIRHPTSGPYYNNELSTFLISQRWHGSTTTFWFYSYRLEHNFDKVAVYIFSYPQGWRFSHLWTHTTSGQYLNAEDIAFFAFFTDDSNVYEGFAIEWYDDTSPSTTEPIDFADKIN